LRRLLAPAFPPEDRGAAAGAPLGCSGCAHAYANPFTGERRYGAVCSPEIDQMFYFCADSTCRSGVCQGKWREDRCPPGGAGVQSRVNRANQFAGPDASRTTGRHGRAFQACPA
jgi:hypothetical protein